MQEIDFQAVEILKKLGQPVRYRIVQELSTGPLTPGQLANCLGKSIQDISQHLSGLHAAGLVRYVTKGNRVIYRIKDRRCLKIVEEARKIAEDAGAFLQGK